MSNKKDVRIICYPKCSTCKKAEEYLKSSGISYSYRDIKLDNPSYEELKELFQKSKLPLKRFFNTSGMAYRELGLKEKLPAMSEEEQLRLLATDGMLVKRPILVTETGVAVGFREAEWENQLK